LFAAFPARGLLILSGTLCVFPLAHLLAVLVRLKTALTPAVTGLLILLIGLTWLSVLISHHFSSP